jgi:oligosaccharide repeat unit polymerase
MIIFILSLLTLSTILFDEDILSSANVNLWLIIFLLGYKILHDRYVSIGSMFIFGFLYIFFKEFLTDIPALYLDWGRENVTIGYMVIIYSFIFLMLGYHYRDFVKDIKPPSIENISYLFIKNRKLFFRINIFLAIAIFTANIFLVFEGLTEGRPNAFKYGIFSSLSYALAVIVIINLKLYYKQFYGRINYIKILLYSFPLFILFIASGTRFLLLYGVIALISDNLYNLSNKKLLKMFAFVMIFGILANMLLEFRSGGFINSNVKVQAHVAEDKSTFNQALVNQFTNEGMLRNAAMITDYTQKNGHTYGQSISFLAYWWVPRILWESKPTQLDFWLIRKYTGDFDESGHSTASGFYGELYIDFGKYFIMPIIFLLGYFFSYLNFRFIVDQSNFNYYSLLISSSILAWVFFLVRSIMTSSFLLIFIILSAYLMDKYLRKWKILK